MADPTKIEKLEPQVRSGIDLVGIRAAEAETKRAIAEEKQALEKRQAQLEELAATDSLTGLHNRGWFDEELARKIAVSNRTGAPLFVIQFDIDYFKLANTHFGHEGGDKIIKLIAKLHHRIEEPLCRVGGEEFAQALNEKVNKKKAISIARRYMTEMRNQSILLIPSLEVIGQNQEEAPKEFTLSVGITQYKQGDSPDILVRRANLAMLKAKETGRNRIYLARQNAEAVKFREVQ